MCVYTHIKDDIVLITCVDIHQEHPSKLIKYLCLLCKICKFNFLDLYKKNKQLMVLFSLQKKINFVEYSMIKIEGGGATEMLDFAEIRWFRY